MFVIQDNRPAKKNRLDSIVDALSPAIDEGIAAYRRKGLLEQFNNAQGEEKQRAYNEVLGSRFLSPQEKALFQKDWNDQQAMRQKQQELSFLQSLFEPQPQAQGYAENRGQFEQSHMQMMPQEDQMRTYSPQQLAAISAIAPNAARILQESQNQMIQQKERELTRVENAFADTKKDILNQYQAIPASQFNIAEQKQLNESGKMTIAPLAALAKSYNLPFFMSAASQNFEKLSTANIKNAKQVFGSRVTQGEIELLLKTVAQVSNTQEGRRLLLDRAEDALEFPRLRFEALKEEEQKGVTSTLAQRVEENYSKKAEAYTKSLLQKYKAQNAPKIKVRNKETGEVLRIPDFELENAQKDGYERI